MLPPKGCDFILAHEIEIVRHLDLAGHEAKTPGLATRGSIHRDDLHHRLASLGDDERLAFGRPVDEAG
ncbi:hypothetical protein GCM10023144_17050 [Pigmentiphaga soli]|uniref:Uncharacterized protein n=1 Tax=Pigmentiphaga soli TaxID=1007095 RepID=A0ABP8GTZ2_9BURK